VLERVIPLETTFPLVEWHEGELADVPSFTVLKTQICVTHPQCVKQRTCRTDAVVFRVWHLVLLHWTVLASKWLLWVSTVWSVAIGMPQSRYPDCVSGRNYGPSHSIVDITSIYVFTVDFMVDRTVDKIVFITFWFCCAARGAEFEV